MAMDGVPDPQDELSHPPTDEAGWEESWTFDFISDDATMAGLARLALLPGQRQAWWWAYLVRPGDRVLVVRDHEVPPPRPPSLEVRSHGLWAELTCLIPMDHWSIGLEAFAVALDHPDDALSGELGERVGLGFDLEWEADAPPRPVPSGYLQRSKVQGDILIGHGPTPQTTSIDGVGTRWHQWGSPPPPLPGSEAAGTDGGEVVGSIVVPLDPPRSGTYRRLLYRSPGGTLSWG